MKVNSWLYHYYMVQSRLQFGLAYGAPTPGQRVQTVHFSVSISTEAKRQHLP